MRTSREIYHWIRWDSRFDPSEFTFGCDDHGAQPKEIALVAFVPDGDIPWHRVLYVRRGNAIVWDRRTGLDRLAAGDARPVVRWPSYTRFSPLQSTTRTGSPAPASASVSILTFNVLDEQHVPPSLARADRAEALIATIAAADADVVVLQEVTPSFARCMQTSSIIRESYDRSHELGSDAPQSVLLLSRLAVRWSGALRFSSQKSATVLGVEHESGPLLVAGVHLPSDWARDSRDLRRAYLRSLVAALDECRAISTVIAGDFNEGDESDFFAELGEFEDTWKLVGVGSGCTWEPARNALAAHASRNGQQRRLDRVWLRCNDRTLSASGAKVIDGPALDEATKLYASDHWPLRVELTTDAPVARTAVDHDPSSALVVLLADGLAREIEPIRAERDAHVGRWPAHVTLLHPFVARSERDWADEMLREILAPREAFEVEVTGVGHFENSRERVVYLSVKSDELQRIERALRARPELARCFVREGYAPHITVARALKDDETIAHFERSLRGRFEGRSFTVESLAWLAKSADGTMRPVARFSVGQSAHARRERAANTVNAAIAAMMGEGESELVWPVGSHAMGVADDESDLDLLAVVPSWCEAALFYDEAARALARSKGVERVQVIDSATVAIVRCEVDGISVDLQRAVRPAREERRGPGYYTEAELDAIDPDSRRAIMAAVDARALRSVVRGADCEHLFSTLTRRVKRWARARQIAGQAYGWMGGLAYAVLAASSLTREKASDEDEAFARFFEHFAGWNGERAIALSTCGSWVRTARDVLPVLAPASPSRNVTRSMTPATKSHWRDEVARARALAVKGELARIEEAISERPKHSVTVVVHAQDERELSQAKARGFVEGRMVRAVMALDARGLRPRPFAAFTERAGLAQTFVIGLRTGAAPPVREECERAFEDAPAEIEFEWR